MRTAVAIGVAGALGALARYGLEGWVSRRAGSFPWGTFVVNVSGSFLLGLLVTLLVLRTPTPQPAHVRELVIPESDFGDLDGDRARTFTSDELPFRLSLSRFARNARPMPARAPMRRAGLPLVDGWALEPVTLAKEAEQNVAGLYVRLEDVIVDRDHPVEVAVIHAGVAPIGV